MKKLEEDIEGAREILRDTTDDEMREMAELELAELEEKRAAVEAELKVLLLPKDPNDEKNVILEVRAGTGGEEACLFAAEDPAHVCALCRAAGLATSGHRFV